MQAAQRHLVVQQREAELLREMESLAPAYKVRPSLLRPLVSVVGLSLGAASSVLPKQASAAISGNACRSWNNLHPASTQRDPSQANNLCLVSSKLKSGTNSPLDKSDSCL